MVFICKIISRNFNLYYYHFILLHFLGATAAALRFGQPSLVFMRRPLACARLEGRAVGTPAGRALDAMVARPALCVPAESQRAAGPPFARQPLTRALMAAGGLAGPKYPNRPQR